MVASTGPMQGVQPKAKATPIRKAPKLPAGPRRVMIAKLVVEERDAIGADEVQTHGE
jgi:hypothetical protein